MTWIILERRVGLETPPPLVSARVNCPNAKSNACRTYTHNKHISNQGCVSGFDDFWIQIRNRIRIDLNCWVRIRIRIEVNTDSQPCFKQTIQPIL
jgi:hypothetical protein